MKKILTIAFLVFALCIPSMSSATVITFDEALPTDVDISYFNYTVGTAPVNVLPTVNSVALTYTSSAVPSSGNALLTRQSSNNFDPYGVLFTFDALQNSVSMVGNDFGGDAIDDNEVVFLSAFDSLGNFLGFTTYSAAYAEPDLKPISISIPNMKYVAFTWNVDLGYYSVDNVSYTSSAVPEPTTLLLFGLGLIGVAGLRRKF